MPSKTEKRILARLAAQARADGIPPPQRGRPGRKGAAIVATATATQSEHAGRIVLPTPERLAMPDKPTRIRAPIQDDKDGREIAAYRVQPPLERMRDRHSLDHRPVMNEAMYQAGMQLVRHFHGSGLTGISAQDLSRVTGHGGSPAYMTPTTEEACYHRQEFRRGQHAMGWYEEHPMRGAGRLTVAVLCYDMRLEDAGRLHCGINEGERAKAVAADRFREGLMALESLWKVRRTDNRPTRLMGGDESVWRRLCG